MKRFPAVIAAFALCLALSSCHGSRGLPEFSMPEEFDETQPVEITFWAKNDTNLTQREIYEKAVSDFEDLYPNVTINFRLYTDYSRIYNDVITNIATGTTPNVCITYPDHIATYLTGDNVVVPLDELAEDPLYGLGGSALKFSTPSCDEVVEKYMEECRIDGVLYALPFMRSTEACYVNRDFVEALGYELPDMLTWDFVWEVSEAAMEKNEDGTFKLNGQTVMIPFIYKSTDNMMIQLLRQSGAGYSTSAGEIQIFNDTTSSLLLEIAGHAQSRSFSTFKISSYPANFLDAGQCVFAVDSTAGATWMGSDAPLSDISDEVRVEFETAVYPVPQMDTENPQMISQGPSICVFNKSDPQEVLASWLFAQFLLSDEVQVAYAETEGYVPVTETARSSDAYQSYLAHTGDDDPLYYDIKLAASKLLLEHTDDTFVTPVFNGSASLRDAAGQLIEDVVKSERRNKPVDLAAIEGFYEDVTSLYRLDQRTDAGSGREDLGPMPTMSVVLLSVLAAIWLLLGVYAIVHAVKKRKLERNCH